MPFMSTISHRIRELLKDTSLSQKNFAQSLGLTPGHLNDILRDRSRPTVRIIEQIIQTYNASANWLLTGNGSRYGERRSEAWQVRMEVVTSREMSLRDGKFGNRRHDFVAVPVFASELVCNLPKIVTNVTNFKPQEFCVVPYKWIKKPKTTFCCKVIGTCVEPMSNHEVMAAVDCSNRSPSRLNGKLCVIIVDQMPLIRRLRTTKAYLIFDTANHPDAPKPIRVKISDENPIIGKLEWACSNHR